MHIRIADIDFHGFVIADGCPYLMYLLTHPLQFLLLNFVQMRGCCFRAVTSVPHGYAGYTLSCTVLFSP